VKPGIGIAMIVAFAIATTAGTALAHVDDPVEHRGGDVQVAATPAATPTTMLVHERAENEHAAEIENEIENEVETHQSGADDQNGVSDDRGRDGTVTPVPAPAASATPEVEDNPARLNDDNPGGKVAPATAPKREDNPARQGDDNSSHRGSSGNSGRR
jgi:hypothetical protein